MERVVMRPLPNGDIFNVRTTEEQEAVLDSLPKLRSPRGVAGANTCPECGAAFTSTLARDEHVKRDHLGFAGKLNTVQLPDGTQVPVELMVETYLAAQKREAATVEALENSIVEEQTRKK